MAKRHDRESDHWQFNEPASTEVSMRKLNS